MLKSTKNDIVTQNTLISNFFGIFILHTNDSEITSNMINDSWEDGVLIDAFSNYCWNNSFVLNSVIYSGDDGMQIEDAHNSTFTKNTISNNDGDGVYLIGASHNNSFYLNTIGNNGNDGIDINLSLIHI